MKIFLSLVAILFCLAATSAHAASVTFEWTPNTEEDLAGYRIYQSQVLGQYEYGAGKAAKEIAAGETTATLTDLADGIYFWVLTAFDQKGNESGPSKELTLDIDTTPPGAPLNFQLKFNGSVNININVQ